MQLTLLIPELVWPEAGDGVLDALDCPALETLLARSRLTRRAPQSLEATLIDLCAPPPGAPPTAPAPPYAALRLLGEAPDARPATHGEHGWLCCDPIHLRYHQQQLILADSGGFEISLDEARQLAAELNRQMPELGRFHVAAAGRWYVQLADPTLADGFATHPLSLVAGRRIEQLLPEVPASRALRSRLNEAQMVLHAHPQNQRREDAGLLPINSLWLWGAGALPARQEGDADAVSPVDFDGIWSASPLARGLALAAGIPAHPLAQDAPTLLEQLAADTNHLVVLDALQGAVHYEQGDAYRGALADLDRHWIAPLRAALGRGTVHRLRIAAPTAYATLTWETTRRAQWALWRRARPLAALARDLAAAP